MPAYLFVNIEVTDPEQYKEYIAKVPATIAAFGGRYLARGGRAETLEGDMTAKRVALVEFPTYERAIEWLNSPMYAPVLAIRQRSAKAEIILVEGA